MNLLDILNNNRNFILTEAIKIDTPEEAYDLIMNKKIGAKIVDNGWFKFLPANKEEFLKKFKKIIEHTKDNAAYAFQLAVNKLDPLTFMQTDPRLFSLLVNFKNKEWAKKNEKYKEFINLNNKLTELDYMDLDDLATELENESDKHGKKAKGSGNTKDLEVAYDKDGWALYIPHNWQAAKAASFYGKKDEEPKPTHWCTRADLKYYDQYTENNTRPLYIIRNYNTGKAYQMAVRPNIINFLDQDDAKGDKIAEGDLTGIPDDLLKLIKLNNNKTLLNYKEDYDGDKFNKFVTDYTNKDSKWTKEELINKNPNIYKQVCINCTNTKVDPFDTYNNNTKQKKDRVVMRYRVEVKGQDDIYYFIDTKKFGKDNLFLSKKDNNGKFIPIDIKYLQTNFPERNKLNNFNWQDLKNFEDSLFRSDFNKGILRRSLNRSEHQKKYNTGSIIYNTIKEDKIINSKVRDLLSKYNYNVVSTSIYPDNEYPKQGSIFPNSINVKANTGKNKIGFYFKRENNKYILKSTFGLSENEEKISNELIGIINNEMSRITKELIKNKDLKNYRMQRRADTKVPDRARLTGMERAMFEDYFPY